MGVLQFQTKLMAAVLITFLLVALCSHAFDSRSGGSRKMNAGRDQSRFQRAGIDSDSDSDSDKGEKLAGINISLRDRVRSLMSKRRVPSPPPAPMRNRQKITVKILATPPSIHHRH